MFGLNTNRNDTVVSDATGEVNASTGHSINDAETLHRMLDSMPINVIMCDPKTLEVTYINQTSTDTLDTLRELLPSNVDPRNLLGTCIDVFHKDPSHQRRILGDRNNLPWNAKIKLGPETLDLRVAAVEGQDGEYFGAMVTWSVCTALTNAIDTFEDRVKKGIEQVASGATSMRQMAESMTTVAEQATAQSTSSAAGAEEATTNVNMVAAAAEELSNSIAEINQQVTQSSTVAGEAVNRADSANTTMQELVISSEKIGEVVNMIQDIANQTNLLALNATIEAARAGEAGKGFAVVATEVKSLAGQTTKATDQITGQISTIQEVTRSAVQAIDDISQTINQMNEVSAAISAAVEEQAATTQEISRNVSEAATGTQDVSNSMTQVQEAAKETGQSAGSVFESASALADESGNILREVDVFLEEVKKI